MTEIVQNIKRDCSTLGFKALMVTQFLGAMNDNVYKTVVSLITIKALVSETSGTFYLSLGSALFLLPFILFSSYAGYLADKHSKTKIIRATAGMEVLVLALGFYFLKIQNIPGLFVGLFLMGVQSTFFGPSKFGILPEILHEDHLSRGNGYTQFWTFLAIIFGTAAAGHISAFSRNDYSIAGLAVFLSSSLGFLASLFVTSTESARSSNKFEINPFKDIFGALSEIRKITSLFLALLAVGYFWFLGAFYQLNVLLYAKQMLKIGDAGTGMLLTVIAFGIGMGSIAAGRVSEGKVELGLVPLGAVGLSLFSIVLGFSYRHYYLTLATLFLLGISGGFFVVPLNAFIQHRSPLTSRGRYLGATNFITFSSMFAASVVLWILKEYFKLSAAHLFIIMGIASIGATVYICMTLPEAFVRCINWVLSHSLYRVRVIGKDNVPAEGGALLVCNHASYVDPSIILASLYRPVRFLMFRRLYEAPLLHPVAKIMRAIPVSLYDPPRQILRSLEEARKAIKNGELVCIFAEGGHTRIGQMLPFKRGFERIMKGIDAPIIPVHLDNIWGSIFSYKDGKYFWKIPEEIPYPITASYGKAMPASSNAHEVRQAIQELSSDAFGFRKETHKLLHVGFLKQAKSRPLQRCMTDSTGVKLTYLNVLASSLALAKVFKHKFNKPTEKMVGVLLPTSAAAAITNIALLIAGKIPVNLNFTASPESINLAKKKCGMSHVIASKVFLEKIGMEKSDDMVFLEALRKEITRRAKMAAWLTAFLMPRFLIRRLFFTHHLSADDIATIIFSSGSTGEPKGVMLTHGNIASNIEGVYAVFSISANDVLVGVLPFFHSFGFTGTLWLPLLAGAKVVYHTNPLDAATIGKLVQKNRGTVMMSTPTFLLNYIRKCTPEQFATLRYVVVGAEKLKAKVAEAFQKQFNIMPMEGYGATELSPIATLNVPDYHRGEIRQKGYKLGKIGHPIPGVAVKIVHPDTFEPLPPNSEGLLLIKGPNVMKGYLGQPDKSKEVIRDGWYVTGDIARLDDDGFVEITDRLSRFSKIGGEMVPHIKVEDAIQRILNETEQVCAVTGLSDEKKGEKLVVLYSKEMDVNRITKNLNDSGLPPLWIPKKENFFRVSNIPILGSGKIDLHKIRALAEELAADKVRV